MSADVITINFCGDLLYAVDRPAGVVVAIKPICQALGLAWTKQLQRIKRDSIMVEGMTMMVIPSVGGAQETICLRIDLINGWLFGIDEARVKDDVIRQRVRDYKRNCYRVLFEHFQARLDCEPPDDAVPALVGIAAAAGIGSGGTSRSVTFVKTAAVGKTDPIRFLEPGELIAWRNERWSWQTVAPQLVQGHARDLHALKETLSEDRILGQQRLMHDVELMLGGVDDAVRQPGALQHQAHDELQCQVLAAEERPFLDRIIHSDLPSSSVPS